MNKPNQRKYEWKVSKWVQGTKGTNVPSAGRCAVGMSCTRRDRG